MEKIYFIGINGIGMSGLAKIMKCKGYDVKGADICTNYVTEELLSMGITVYNEHDEENVKGVDYVIASTAIKETNPELSYAKNNGIEGQVLVVFIVEKDGSISNAEVSWGVDPSLDQEALRIVNKMPKWKPGTQNGVAMRVKYRLPITFMLKK